MGRNINNMNTATDNTKNSAVVEAGRQVDGVTGTEITKGIHPRDYVSPEDIATIQKHVDDREQPGAIKSVGDKLRRRERDPFGGNFRVKNGAPEFQSYNITQHDNGMPRYEPGGKDTQTLRRGDDEYLKWSGARIAKAIRNDFNNLIRSNRLVEIAASPKGKDNYVRLAIASHANTPYEVVKTYLQDKDENVRYHATKSLPKHLAKNLDTSIPELEKLANHHRRVVRAAVAENPNTPTPILEKLANDEEGMVRLSVLKNPNTPLSILEKGIQSPHGWVRAAVAGNSSLSTSDLEKLANDKAYEVRGAVAWNPNTPAPILEKLANDENEHVRKCATKQIRIDVNVITYWDGVIDIIFSHIPHEVTQK